MIKSAQAKCSSKKCSNKISDFLSFLTLPSVLFHSPSKPVKLTWQKPVLERLCWLPSNFACALLIIWFTFVCTLWKISTLFAQAKVNPSNFFCVDKIDWKSQVIFRELIIETSFENQPSEHGHFSGGGG